MLASSVSEFSHPDSQAWSAGPARSGVVSAVPEDAPAFCEATVEAKDDPVLGPWGSGVRVVRRVSQTSGLRLLSRSPSPFTSRFPAV